MVPVLQVASPPVVPVDHAPARSGVAVACHLFVVIVEQRVVGGEFLVGSDIPHGDRRPPKKVGTPEGEVTSLSARVMLWRTSTLDEAGVIVLAEELRVDQVALHLGCNEVFDAVGDAALKFQGHEGGLAEAMPGWIGASQVALGELAARWEVRHGQYKRAVAGLSHGLGSAAVGYTTNEDESAAVLQSLAAPGC